MGVLEGGGDDGVVDLHEVDRQLPQHLEAGVARADVVEREPESEAAEASGVGDHLAEPRIRALGDLEHDLRRAQARGRNLRTSRSPARLRGSATADSR